VTINPYLGYDSVAPFMNRCRDNGKGIFVLVRTSNPSAGEFQDLLVRGEPAYVAIARRLHEWGLPFVGRCGYSFVGAVVGGTAPEALASLRETMPRAVFLVPGFGAQGAGADEVVCAFDRDGRGAVVNASRSIIFAYESEPFASQFGPDEWAQAVSEAARQMADKLQGALDRRPE
jgi:orotidine-5'-phosphate decarboxylase